MPLLYIQNHPWSDHSLILCGGHLWLFLIKMLTLFPPPFNTSWPPDLVWPTECNLVQPPSRTVRGLALFPQNAVLRLLWNWKPLCPLQHNGSRCEKPRRPASTSHWTWERPPCTTRPCWVSWWPLSCPRLAGRDVTVILRSYSRGGVFHRWKTMPTHGVLPPSLLTCAIRFQKPGFNIFVYSYHSISLNSKIGCFIPWLK